MKKLFVLILGLYCIAAYPMDNQTNDQLDQYNSHTGSFCVNLFSIRINEEKRFLVEEFRNILNKKFDLSFLDPEDKPYEPDAFINALRFLPIHFCEDDEAVVKREVVRALLMYPEIRQEPKYKTTIEECATDYFSCLINKKNCKKKSLEKPIKEVLGGIPDVLPDKNKWSDFINDIISEILRREKDK